MLLLTSFKEQQGNIDQKQNIYFEAIFVPRCLINRERPFDPLRHHLYATNISYSQIRIDKFAASLKPERILSVRHEQKMKGGSQKILFGNDVLYLSKCLELSQYLRSMKNIGKVPEEFRVSLDKKQHWKKVFLMRICHSQNIRQQTEMPYVVRMQSSEINLIQQTETQLQSSGLSYLDFNCEEE